MAALEVEVVEKVGVCHVCGEEKVIACVCSLHKKPTCADCCHKLYGMGCAEAYRQWCMEHE